MDKISGLVKFSNVSKFYGKKEVLQNIEFNLEKGTITVLLGPNGAGKSTIAKLILGKESPTGGAIDKAKAIKISYLPQNIKIPSSIPISCSELARLNNITKQ
ncbi:MAG: ATP-binding cassette domain-containing protein, partial [Rickettsiaceae bacterium]|nr:ATP-binding cassette domain-containing protein [Rickettsiaceae bacterium]